MYPEELPLLFKRIARDRKEKALEQITHWAMLLDIAVAPYTKDGAGVRNVHAELREMRRRIELSDREVREIDHEFHRQLAELNKRRRARKGGETS